jgi:hypothetical protein
MSQILMVLSEEPDAMYFSSGLKDTELTSLFMGFPTCSPVLVFQILIMLSGDIDAIYFPFGLNEAERIKKASPLIGFPICSPVLASQKIIVLSSDTEMMFLLSWEDLADLSTLALQRFAGAFLLEDRSMFPNGMNMRDVRFSTPPFLKGTIISQRPR